MTRLSILIKTKDDFDKGGRVSMISLMDNNLKLVIDGVVGAGKSTLMRLLQEERGYEAFPEPVVDNPILDKFYYDRKRYSFPLQIFFLNKRFKYIKEASEKGNVVMDRSIYTDIIFAKMLADGNDMTKEEFNIYHELLNNMLEHCNPPTLMIYLEITPENAIDRIIRRGRDYELHVEKDYWVRLNNYYKDFFCKYNRSEVLKIDINGLDFENNEDDRIYIMDKIDKKLMEIQSKY